MTVFVLGSGFSKAVGDAMPTVRELGLAFDFEALPGRAGVYRPLRDDPEALLTYLASPHPWKSPEDRLTDRAAFVALVRQLARLLREREAGACAAPPPDWALRLVRAWADQGPDTTVVTLNYDTMVERLAWQARGAQLRESRLYRLPLAHLGQRTTAVGTDAPQGAFRLLKLHGSVNWYAQESEHARGIEQVFYVPVDSASPLSDAEAYRDQLEINRADLVPLIIPPVADKGGYYDSQIVRVQWRAFAQALESADEVVFIGYSLPPSDLTMRLFLRTRRWAGRRARLVDCAAGPAARALVARFAEVTVGGELDADLVGRPDAVAQLADCLEAGRKVDGHA